MTTITSDSPFESEQVSGWIVLLLAVSCGLLVANLYYAQPLVGPISQELGLSPQAAGLIVTMGQLGYGAGLLLIVPLGDLIENRRLVLMVIGLGVLALLGAALSTSPLQFLSAALLIGFEAEASTAPAAGEGRTSVADIARHYTSVLFMANGIESKMPAERG